MSLLWTAYFISIWWTLAKLSGYILSIDQASNIAGASLWYQGALIATTTLVSKSADDPFSRRVQHQVPQLTAFLQKHLKPGHLVETVVFEGVRARLVMLTVGSFLTCPLICAKVSEKHSFVESSSWKKYAKERGATEPFTRDVKGCKALREIGFDLVKHGITSDDVADSVLIYMCWRDRQVT